jgi:hypothetical protein
MEVGMVGLGRMGALEVLGWALCTGVRRRRRGRGAVDEKTRKSQRRGKT